jgi:hypothetical protein
VHDARRFTQCEKVDWCSKTSSSSALSVLYIMHKGQYSHSRPFTRRDTDSGTPGSQVKIVSPLTEARESCRADLSAAPRQTGLFSHPFT